MNAIWQDPWFSHLLFAVAPIAIFLIVNTVVGAAQRRTKSRVQLAQEAIAKAKLTPDEADDLAAQQMLERALLDEAVVESLIESIEAVKPGFLRRMTEKQKEKGGP